MTPGNPLMERIARRQAQAEARAAELKRRIPEVAAWLVAMGATRVRLFGSLATGAQPHAQTDVDLCVEGLDCSAAGEASLELELLLGAHVDVVRWEDAGERLRARVASDGLEVHGEP